MGGIKWGLIAPNFVHSWVEMLGFHCRLRSLGTQTSRWKILPGGGTPEARHSKATEAFSKTALLTGPGSMLGGTARDKESLSVVQGVGELGPMPRI